MPRRQHRHYSLEEVPGNGLRGLAAGVRCRLKKQSCRCILWHACSYRKLFGQPALIRFGGWDWAKTIGLRGRARCGPAIYRFWIKPKDMSRHVVIQTFTRKRKVKV